MRKNRFLCRFRVGRGCIVLAMLLATVVAGQAPRYRNPGDGTVQDSQSGLLWLADADCWGPMPWKEAKALVARLEDGMCGLKDGSKPGDWRLPTQKEWSAMVECSCGEIVLTDDQGTGCYASGGSTFHGVQPRKYWSSTQSSSAGGKVGAMSLHDGFVYMEAAGASLRVWPVRRAAPSESPKSEGVNRFGKSNVV